MRRVARRGVTVGALLCGLGAAGAAGPAGAQITGDGSLGPARTLAGPDHRIPAWLGQVRGGNLFQSFGRFDLAPGQSATFTGPAAIRHVIARVTGGSPSTIDGLVRSAIPGADLFLLNPAGILFGRRARVDVGGSFPMRAPPITFAWRTARGSTPRPAAAGRSARRRPRRSGFSGPRPGRSGCAGTSRAGTARGSSSSAAPWRSGAERSARRAGSSAWPAPRDRARSGSIRARPRWT